MGSDSDFKVMEESLTILQQFGVSYDVKISSAHRTLERTIDWVRAFEDQGGKLIIAGAGLAAHLPGVLAGASILPVIGVTLPFFSYGGSSIVTCFAAMGIVSGIKMRPKPVRFRNL